MTESEIHGSYARILLEKGLIRGSVAFAKSPKPIKPKVLFLSKKLFLLIMIMSLYSCQSVKDALSGKKYESSDEFLVIKKNPEQVLQIKNGNLKAMGWFVGQVMKSTKGSANPQLVNEILKKKLGV